MMMSSSFISSHPDKTKLVTNAFILNQIGRLQTVESTTFPLQIYMNECFDWWKSYNKYTPHMYRLTSPEGECSSVKI